MDNYRDAQRKSQDQLTGAMTVAGFLAMLEQMHRTKAGESYTFVYISIPNFKSLNQSYGYVSGNQFLQSFSDLLQYSLPGAMVARESSHHFLVLSLDMDVEEMLCALRRIQDQVSRMKGGNRLWIHAGLVAGTLGQLPSNEFHRNIDLGRYASSYAGNAPDRQFVVYGAQVQNRLDFELYLLREFEGAMERRDIQPFYQPEVRVLTKSCCGYEALARWVDGRYGLISPADFIPLLEREMLIPQLDMHILRFVCRDIRHEINCGQRVVPVSVNLSPIDFQVMDIFAEVEKIRQEFDIPRHFLHIEVTESAVAEGSNYLAPVIDRFRQVGYQVWMDDFGSGYSSLNNLQSFNFDVLKIDMGFLRSFHTNPKSGVIVREIVNLAKRMGISTLAEGVETQEQFDFLKESGCEMVQGYFFSKPIQTRRGGPHDPMLPAEVMERLPRETREESRYYKRIADVNVLSAAPMDSSLYSTGNSLPIGVIEVIGGRKIHFLYGNAAYQRQLRMAAIQDLGSADARANQDNVKENIQFLKMAERAEEQERVRSDILINGLIFKSDMSFLCRNRDRAAFLVVDEVSLPNRDSAKDNPVALAQQYIFSEYFRVDLFDEGGTGINVFLAADQERLTDEESDSVKLVDTYARLYIHPDEADRFREFYDLRTVLERTRAAGASHITALFHSGDPDHLTQIQAYTITPFRMGERWKFLSTCRIISE